MGDPVKINDLARDMIELSGYQVGDDIEIQYTGLRPGERLYEILFSQDESRARTHHQKIFVARNGTIPSLEIINRDVQMLEELARAGRSDELLQQLKAMTTV